MSKKVLLNAINKNPGRVKEALETMYHGKTYAIGRNEYVETFKKTKRGADGYIKRSQSLSWYDDYSHEMVNGGAGLFIEVIQENEILPLHSKQLWYNYLKEIHGHDYLYNQALKLLDQYEVPSDVKEYVTETIDDMKNFRGMTAIEEFEKEEMEEEQQEETTETYNSDKEEKHDQNAAPVTIENEITVTSKLNEEKNGIELYFSGKPSKETRDLLKAYKFRWSKYNKCWYAKQSNDTLQLAEQLTGTQANNSNEQESPDTTEQTNNVPTYPEIEIEDISSYVVSDDLSRREQDSSWVFRKNERDHTQEIQQLFTQYNDEVKEILQTTDNPYIIYTLKKSLQYFKKHYFNNYVKRLEHTANNPSWVVTGRSGRNAAKDQKAINRYDNLMRESIHLTDDFKRRLKRAESQIRKDKENKLKQEMNNTDINITFKAETKEFVYMGLHEKRRCYVHGDYFICKLWNVFRVFKNGRELDTPLNTLSKLSDAKKYVSMLVFQEQQEQQQKAV